VLVIGYGNPSRRDDGVGHYVVESLERLTSNSFHKIHLTVSLL